MVYADSVLDVKVIKTSTLLDKLSGIGGIPMGRISEIYGEASVGKSTLSLHAIAEAQKVGMRCLFADAEWSYDARYAESLGVDNSKLGLIREEFAEDILDKVEEEIRTGNWDLVVLDSIGGLLPRQEAEKASGEKTIGGQASLVARFCRKIVPLLFMKETALVVLNHSFTDLMTGRLMTSGGMKLNFHKSFSVRLKVNTKKEVRQGDRKIGKVIVGTVTKNKLAKTEGLTLESSIIFGEGFSSAQDLLGDALEAGVFTKSGNSYYFLGEKIGMVSRLREWLKENEELVKSKLT